MNTIPLPTFSTKSTNTDHYEDFSNKSVSTTSQSELLTKSNNILAQPTYSPNTFSYNKTNLEDISNNTKSSTISTSENSSTSSIQYSSAGILISAASQTDTHPDIPYQINSPLPPIFRSTLFHQTPRISFMSNSLPSLEAICWGKIDDDEQLRDLAEEALADQYDRQVTEFYLSERERVRELKKVLRN